MSTKARIGWRSASVRHVASINVTHLVEAFGYPLLFGVVMAESQRRSGAGRDRVDRGGAWPPARASSQIELVIAIAATAAIVGDNIGYQIGRKGGRWLLERPGRFHASASRCLSTGEPFFERHGPKAVFFGRFLVGVARVGVVAGGRQPHALAVVLLWNAPGASAGRPRSACSPTSSERGGQRDPTFGLFGLAAVLLVGGGALVAHSRHRRHADATAQAAARQVRRGPEPGAALGGGLESRPAAARRERDPTSSPSASSSSSEKCERKCSRTTARWVPRAAHSRSRPLSVRHA